MTLKINLNYYKQTNSIVKNNINNIIMYIISLIVNYQDGYDKSGTMCIAVKLI